MGPTFQASPAESVHYRLFESCVEQISKCLPAAFILENVAGILLATSETDKESFLHKLLRQLRDIPGYDVEHVVLNAHPLPIARSRVYIVGHRVSCSNLCGDSHTASSLAAAAVPSLLYLHRSKTGYKSLLVAHWSAIAGPVTACMLTLQTFDKYPADPIDPKT